jgi:hypothetical protein
MIDFDDDGIVQKWRQTGLLCGQEDEYEAKTLAWMLEDMCQVFIQEAQTNYSFVQSIAGSLLPIIARLFKARELRFMNAEKLYSVFCEYFKEHKHLALADVAGFCETFVQECEPSEFMF